MDPLYRSSPLRRINKPVTRLIDSGERSAQSGCHAATRQRGIAEEGERSRA